MTLVMITTVLSIFSISVSAQEPTTYKCYIQAENGSYLTDDGSLVNNTSLAGKYYFRKQSDGKYVIETSTSPKQYPLCLTAQTDSNGALTNAITTSFYFPGTTISNTQLWSLQYEPGGNSYRLNNVATGTGLTGHPSSNKADLTGVSGSMYWKIIVSN
jgi:hypothetical protein